MHYQQLKELSENLQICPVALYLHFSILVYVLQTLKLWTVDFFDKNQGGTFYYFSTKAPQAYTDITYPDRCYIVFGKETKGLPEKLLFDNPDTTVRIPMLGEIRSLNLSNSVAIAAYEILRQWDFPELQNFGRLREFRWEDTGKIIS